MSHQDAGSVSARLRRAVRLSGMSRYELARQADVSQSVLSRLVRGRGKLSLVNLERIADALDLDYMIDVQRAHELLKDKVTFIGNSASNRGGGVYNDDRLTLPRNEDESFEYFVRNFNLTHSLLDCSPPSDKSRSLITMPSRRYLAIERRMP